MRRDVALKPVRPLDVARIPGHGGTAVEVALPPSRVVARFGEKGRRVRVPPQACGAALDLIRDVRDEQSYVMGHIPGAILIPLEQIEQKAATLKGEPRLIVTYCS